MSKNENNLSLAVVPQQFLIKMESELNEVKAILKAKNDEEINQQWIESVKIPKLLGISRKTWQTYRDKRLIKFSQISNKIFVKSSDLDAFMQDHCIESIDSLIIDTKTKG